MSFEMTLEKWILVIAAVLAVGTGLFLFPYEEQNPVVVEQYQQEITDNVNIIDLYVTVSEDVTKEDVVKEVNKRYPNFEIVEITKRDNQYLIRIKEVIK